MHGDGWHAHLQFFLYFFCKAYCVFSKVFANKTFENFVVELPLVLLRRVPSAATTEEKVCIIEVALVEDEFARRGEKRSQ